MNRWLAEWRGSTLRQFFCWWGGELLGMLPGHWRAALTPKQQDLYLLPDAHSLVLLDPARIRASNEPLTADTAQRIIGAAAARAGLENPLLCLLLPEAVVLRHPISMPLAAEENLGQVLGFEMDAHTPFTADQVYFDYRIVKRDTQNARVQIDLALAPRERVDRWLGTAHQMGIALDAVDIAPAGDDELVRAGFNLLPAQERPHRANRQLRINLALAGLVLFLVGSVMWLSLDYREQRLAAYQAAANQARHTAMSTVKLRKQLTDAVAGAKFLLDKRRATPTTADVLLAMTRALPDNTYAQLLRIRNGTVEVTGLSESSSALIAKVAESPLFDNPSFRSSVTQDRRTGKERFNLTMKLVGGAQALGENREQAVDTGKLQSLINDKLRKLNLDKLSEPNATNP